MKRRNYFSVLISSLMFVLFTTGCGLIGAQPAKPVVKVDVPQVDGGFATGQSISMQVAAADSEGLARIDVQIDGQPYASVAADPNQQTFIVGQSWTPDVPGSHIIQAQAVNVKGVASDPVNVMVQVEPLAQTQDTPAQPADVVETEPVAEPEPVAADVIEASAGDSLTAPVAEATPTVAAPTPTPAEPSVVALVNLNVRTGPGVEYPAIGQLVSGQTAAVTGRSPDAGWFKIAFSGSPDGFGWVSASPVYVQQINTANVPVTAVPLLPTATPRPTTTTAPPAPAPIDTPAPPAPAPVQPTIHYFGASSNSITAGESVTLQWDLSNAQAAYLVYDSHTEGVVAPGSKTVSPAASTTYMLVAVNTAGQTTASVDVLVTPSGGGSNPLPPIDPLLPINPLPPMIDPGLLHPIVTPTPDYGVIIPLITPMPTFELIPGFVIPSP